MKDQKNLIHFLNILGERIKEHQSDIACEISDTLLGSLKSQNKKPPVAQSSLCIRVNWAKWFL